MAEETIPETPQPANAEPPMADPGTTPELMTDEQRNAFALKERARILALSGSQKLEVSHEKGLISDADFMAMRLQEREALLEPQAVIEAPSNPPTPGGARCC